MCVDGALVIAMTDLCTWHYARDFSEAGSSMAVGSLEQFKLCSWFLSADCCNHASSNGLNWPLKDGNWQRLDDEYKWATIQSCRSATASLARHRERWIASRLVFRYWAFEGSYFGWTWIGVESTVCDLIVTLQLRVVGSSILVADDYANDDQIVQKVVVTGAICKCKEWSDSWWVTIGDTSRYFLGACLLDIGDFFAFGHTFCQISPGCPSHWTNHRSSFSCFVRQRCCVGHAFIQ